MVRIRLERVAARQTAAAITPGQVMALKELVEKEKKISGNIYLEEYDVINAKFHLMIAEFANNSVLYAYIKELLDRTRIYLILFDPFMKLGCSAYTEAHQTIVDALADHSAERAEKAVHAHLQSWVEGLDAAEVIPNDYLAI